MSKFCIVILSLTLILCALLIGCQPTPEKPVVVQKNDLDQQSMQTAAPASSDATEDIWQETLEQDGVKVLIDATIEKPDVASWPVIKVSPYGFTEQDAQKAVDVFMQGQPVYQADRARSKNDIEQDIIWINRRLEEAKTDDMIDSEFLKGELKDDQEEYNHAPVKEPKKEQATIKFATNSDLNAEVSKSIYVQADLGDSTPAKLSVDVSDDNFFSGISFMHYDNHRTFYNAYQAADTLTGLNISKQEALDTAQETLRRLGVGDVELAYAQAGVDDYDIRMSAYADSMFDPSRKKCYILKFSRVIQGIPVTYAEYTNGISTDDDSAVSYDHIWSDELIEVLVDDSGILRLHWQNPCTIEETLNENAKLMDFKEIKEIFRKQMFFEKTWSLSPSDKNAITINRAVFGFMRVKMQSGQYAYMPVWDFIGEWKTEAQTTMNLSFLTLNAVDGSVINRELGY